MKVMAERRFNLRRPLFRVTTFSAPELWVHHHLDESVLQLLLFGGLEASVEDACYLRCGEVVNGIPCVISRVHRSVV